MPRNMQDAQKPLKMIPIEPVVVVDGGGGDVWTGISGCSQLQTLLKSLRGGEISPYNV